VDVGSRTSEGDVLLQALRTRHDYGVDGTGVRVGVISDGIFGVGNAAALGDLPPTTLVREGNRLVGTTGGVTSVSFRADRDLEATFGPGRGAEGVAMLEVVHDLAPGALLFFANFLTDMEFNQAIDDLAANTDIVVDDISFFGGPYDGTSSISANAAAALNNPAFPIRALFTSGGNRALDHYEEPYEPSGVDGLPFIGEGGQLHSFHATAKTTDASGLGRRIGEPIFLFRNQVALVMLTWPDPDPSFNDYDVFLFDDRTGELLTGSNAPQDGRAGPLEAFVFVNTVGDGFFDIRIQNFLDSAAPRDLELFVLESPFRTVFPTGATLNYNTTAGSVPMMADAGGGVVSVGAINAADPGLDDIEPFSSRGPTNDGRLKPEIASLDAVAVTGSGGFSATFFGTSAAAPHAAGVAALLLQMAPCLMDPAGDSDAERQALRQAIFDRAIDVGPPGPDFTFGHGRNDAFAAAAAMLPLADAGPPVSLECTSPAGASTALDASASRPSFPGCPLDFSWLGPFGTASGPAPTVSLPLGTSGVHLTVSQNGVTRVAADTSVTVRDTTPPDLAASASPSLLWPPNHRMVEVEASVAVRDVCDPHPDLVLASVASSEPDDAPGTGDGRTTGDIQGALLGTPDLGLLLRAERDGGGPGRRYTATYVATDASGNSRAAQMTVSVPHDRGASSAEPVTLLFTDASNLRWSEAPGAVAYQVVRGNLPHPRPETGGSTMDLRILASSGCP